LDSAAPNPTFGGCACGTYGPCCANPEREFGHELFCDCDNDYCDYRWHCRCATCGAQCGCNV
jgi:hypothetical protein